LYAGPISANNPDASPSFSDVIRTAFAPPIEELLVVLARSQRVSELVVE
jgi:hypothetical protein